MNGAKGLLLAALAAAVLTGCTGYPAHMGWGGHHGGPMMNGADDRRQAPRQAPCPDEPQRDRQQQRRQECEPVQ